MNTSSQFPLRIIIVAALVSMTTVLFAVSIFYSNEKNAHSYQLRNTQLQELSGEILLYDEQLTSSVLLASFSGDEKWIDAYEKIADKLTIAIDRAIDLADTDKIRAAANATDAANSTLVDLENQAIINIREGRLKIAVSLLTGNRYENQKEQYTAGMQAVLQLMSEKQLNEQKMLHESFLFAVAIVLTSLALMSLLWIKVYKTIKLRSLNLQKEENRRVEAETQILQMNKQLESRVEERTSQLRASQAELQKQANYDDLTGLPNRRFVLEHLKVRLESPLTETQISGKACVMLLDLDHFKRVNDTLGHAAGDELLRQTANRLKNVLGTEDVVARLGGDEFLIITASDNQDQNVEHLTPVINNIMDQFRVPFVLEGREYKLPISPSIGVAIAPEDGKDVAEIMRNADTAMYAAKDHGRNTACYFIPEMNRIIAEGVLLERKLRDALRAKDQFKLHYQPQIELTTNRILGVEALIRWEQPEDGLISPDQFIPLAEESGLIDEIGDWVLFEAARQSREWQDNHGIDVIMSINVASQQLRQKSFLNKVQFAFSEHGIQCDRFGVEFTEHSMIGNDHVTNANIDGLKKMDIKLALDDFGTGYSALSYLMKYPFDYLKIDRSFTATIMKSPRNSALVKGIINMSRDIDLKVICEGTETKEECDLLRTFGCDIAQGYFYSKPLAPKQLVDFFDSWGKWNPDESSNLTRRAS